MSRGHAKDAMVADGRVRRGDKEGNDAADIAADFGRLRQPEVVIDARRNFLSVKKEWYPRMLVLHKFMVAIARQALNHGDADGSLIDALLWDKGSKPKVDLAGMLGPPWFS